MNTTQTLCRACNERPANSPDYPGVCRWESCEKVGFAQMTDRKLAELHTERAKVDRDLMSVADSIHRAVGDKRHEYRSANGRRLIQGAWKLSLEECMTMRPKYDYASALERFEKDCAAVPVHRAEIDRLTAAIDELDAVYVAHGRWPRFFLVVSSDGHIHSSMGCSTCNPRTAYAWLPDLSGLDEAAAVAAHGAKLCTHCYPSAPVEWTNFFDAAEKAKRSDRCPGQRVKIVNGYYHCTECDQRVRRTPNGYARAHKKESK